MVFYYTKPIDNPRSMSLLLPWRKGPVRLRNGGQDVHYNSASTDCSAEKILVTPSCLSGSFISLENPDEMLHVSRLQLFLLRSDTEP